MQSKDRVAKFPEAAEIVENTVDGEQCCVYSKGTTILSVIKKHGNDWLCAASTVEGYK